MKSQRVDDGQSADNGLRSSRVPVLRGPARQENARNREPCYFGTTETRNGKNGGVKPPL